MGGGEGGVTVPWAQLTSPPILTLHRYTVAPLYRRTVAPLHHYTVTPFHTARGAHSENLSFHRGKLQDSKCRMTHTCGGSSAAPSM